MDYVEISNSMIVYLLCGITVAIAFVQAVLYIRMAKKMTVKANIPATVPKTAFRVGLISAIGPALGVFYRNGWSYDFDRRSNGMAETFHHWCSTDRAYCSNAWC